MTLTQLRQRVSEHVSEPIISTGWFTPTSVNSWVNSAVEAVFLKIIAVNPDYFGTKIKLISFVAEQQEYALNANTFEIRRVEITDQGSPYFLGELDVSWKNVSSSSGEPYAYYWIIDYDTPIDPTIKIGLIPKPDRSATNNATVYYLPRPRTLSLDADYPDLPTETHELIALWAAIIGLRSDQRPTGDLQAEFNFRIGTILGLAARGRSGGPTYVHYQEPY